MVKHSQGVDNKLADLLSRRFQPGVHFVVPQVLVGVREVPIPFIVASDPLCQTGREGSVAFHGLR